MCEARAKMRSGTNVEVESDTMKNNRKSKLALSTETLRSLADDKLADAAGGYTAPSAVPARSCPRHNSCTYCVQ